ncbi:MAG: extracellular solute-binding protein [Treponema sp.]|jgi:putative aldouronate transport system substrate-binding protein|nr:extracellular solute-binding protein [Treponema sp.]
MKRAIVCVLMCGLALGAMYAGGRSQSSSGGGGVYSTIEVTRLNIPEEPWLVPYNTPVVMTTVNSPYVDNKFSLPTDNESNNLWTRAYKKYLNIELQTLWVSNEYDTNLNLAIASGEIPDVFKVNDTQFRQLMEAGMLEDITDAVTGNVSTKVKAYYDFVPSILDAYRKNGRLYGFPQMYYGDIEIPHYMWFRKDWAAALGFNGDPKTVDELVRRMEAVNQRYGAKGIAVDKGISELYAIAPMWHAAPNIWVTGRDGTIVYGTVQPEMKTAIAAFADWYKRGLINPNFAIEDGDTVKTDVINGKYGVQPFAQWWGWYAGEGVVNNNGPQSYFEPYLLPSIDNNPVLYPLNFPNYGTIVVRKGYQHADAVMKLFNMYVFIEMDGKKYKVFSDVDLTEFNTNEHTMPFIIRAPTIDYNGYIQTQDFKKNGDISVFDSQSHADDAVLSKRYDESGSTGMESISNVFGRYLQMYNGRSSYGLAKGIVDRDEFIRNKIWGATPEGVAKYGSTLSDMLLEGFTQIILGNQPIGHFDTLVRNWYAQGGQEMTDAVNAMYGGK